VQSLNLEKLSPEEKVNLSINMVDVCTRICADAIREQNKTIDEKGLREKLRARMQFGKRHHLRV
jgi:hypothetical protein